MTPLNETITRRQALRDIGAATLGATAAASGIEDLLAAAAEASPRHGALKDIEHVVILIQENRSFDHYFGSLSGVAGFGDKHNRKAFQQPRGDGSTLQPWRLPTGCLPDITHDWAPQHQSVNGGRMDGFVTARNAVDGADVAPETMGYYTRADLPFYYALADAFTICDHYHCSVIGPTDPNRLMSMTGTIDPAGRAGGPLLKTNIGGRTGKFGWRTMPEQLEAKGVSWKVYTDGPGGGILDNVLTYFTQYTPTSTLTAKGTKPTYPADFLADISANKLPKVSWVLTSIADTEHPDFSTPGQGEAATRAVVEAVMSNPHVWRKTALFVTWDENGGFFDHVPPPTPPQGTPGEWLTVATLPPEAGGIRGPIGLGMRVPMLVVSPFSRGGLLCSDVFDHTSMLRFLETRFGVKVPNLSRWRRRMTGDLTSAFNLAARPRYRPPGLAQPANSQACKAFDPVPVVQGAFPRQEKGKRKRPSGIVVAKPKHKKRRHTKS